MSFVERARSALVVVGALYVGAVGLLATVPWIQTQTVYLHAARFPFGADYTQPEKYGLAPNKTLNLRLEVPEEGSEPIHVGAWFVLSDAYYHSLPSLPAEPPSPNVVHEALKTYPTILFLHGNAGTRAFHIRVKHYSMYSSRFKANVMAVDYRGYAESEGTPTEAGVTRDARAAWDWLVANGAAPEDIVVIGHSLGTGIATNLIYQLETDGQHPRGCVLMSPFTSIADVAKTYHILGLLPLVKPLHMIPYAASYVTNSVIHKFNTQLLLPNTTTPLIIAHANNDFDIPYTHSEILFNTLLDPYLPPIPDVPPVATLGQGPGGIDNNWASFSKALAERNTMKEQLVRKTDIRGLGTIEEFYAPFPEPPTINGRMIRLVLTERGKHDSIGLEEGLQDVIGRSFDLI
ncbi:Alpha/Beta hydrolase protein [Flagelloscypha sp. PMI_526]|nr:Alpha/Beta hydrolase protein [Flagelloscypha sp. PMI_526]